MSYAGLSEQQVIDQVTGSDAYLASALGGNEPLTNDYSGALGVSTYGQGSASLSLPGFPGSTGTPQVIGSSSTSPQTTTPWGQVLQSLNPFGNFNPIEAGQALAKTQTSQNVTNNLAEALGLPSAQAVITLILGIIVLIAGLFLLSKGPAINLVAKHAKDLAVGA